MTLKLILKKSLSLALNSVSSEINDLICPTGAWRPGIALDLVFNGQELVMEQRVCGENGPYVVEGRNFHEPQHDDAWLSSRCL